MSGSNLDRDEIAMKLIHSCVAFFEVDGSAHKAHGARKWDARKDEYYEGMGLWHERLKNKEVKRENVEMALLRHTKPATRENVPD